jgi:hypothetical protein
MKAIGHEGPMTLFEAYRFLILNGIVMGVGGTFGDGQKLPKEEDTLMVKIPIFGIPAIVSVVGKTGTPHSIAWTGHEVWDPDENVKQGIHEYTLLDWFPIYRLIETKVEVPNVETVH